MVKQYNAFHVKLTHEYVKKSSTISCQQPILIRIQNVFYNVKFNIWALLYNLPFLIHILIVTMFDFSQISDIYLCKIKFAFSHIYSVP